MSDQTYNGWTNYETWGVALVLDNDQGTYTEVREAVERCKADAPNDDNVAGEIKIWTVEQAAKFRLAEWLKDFTEELCGLDSEVIPEPSLMARQLLGGALSDVNFDEIAEDKLSES
jgi:hypothetical protein